MQIFKKPGFDKNMTITCIDESSFASHFNDFSQCIHCRQLFDGPSLLQALSGIGLVIFTALDFGLGEDQERALSMDLETLLDLLASEGMCIITQF